MQNYIKNKQQVLFGETGTIQIRNQNSRAAISGLQNPNQTFTKSRSALNLSKMSANNNQEARSYNMNQSPIGKQWMPSLTTDDLLDFKFTQNNQVMDTKMIA